MGSEEVKQSTAAAMLKSGRGTRRFLCPLCSDSRKGPRKNDPTLSCTVDPVDRNRVLYFCHHCQEKGAYRLVDEPKEISAPKPSPAPLRPGSLPPVLFRTEPLSQAGKDWLLSRGITSGTAIRCGVRTTFFYSRYESRDVEGVAFVYKEDPFGLQVGVKARALARKEFTQAAGSAQILYGLQMQWEPSDTVILTEGEMDALSLIECGYTNVYSQPGGAIDCEEIGTPKDFFLRHSEKLFQRARKIILAVDSDEKGEQNRDELARRLGKGKCFVVHWPEDCKDANDVLVKYGKSRLKECVDAAAPYPVSGIVDYTDQKAYSRLLEMYDKPHSEGYSTGWSKLDPLYKPAPGMLTVVTGHPGTGKTTVLSNLFVNLAQEHGWHFGVLNFELDPDLSVALLVQQYIRKPYRPEFLDRMTPAEWRSGVEWVTERFHFLTYHGVAGEATVQDILAKAEVMLLRHGIRGFVLDPYNYVALNKDQEHEAVSVLLTELKRWAMSNQVAVWIVAHPTKLQKVNGVLPVPGGYEISGSAAWFAKPDFGMTVHRPRQESIEDIEIHLWKVRYSWLGREGAITLKFDAAAQVCYEFDLQKQIAGVSVPPIDGEDDR